MKLIYPGPFRRVATAAGIAVRDVPFEVTGDLAQQLLRTGWTRHDPPKPKADEAESEKPSIEGDDQP